MIHPWRALERLPHITLLWHDGGPMGLADFAASTISIRRGLSQAERRCTVMHEIRHHERGPVPQPLLIPEETRVRKETARLMLPDVREIGDALELVQMDLTIAASSLWVDVDLLRDRLRWLHPAERGYLRGRLTD